MVGLVTGVASDVGITTVELELREGVDLVGDIDPVVPMGIPVVEVVFTTIKDVVLV